MRLIDPTGKTNWVFVNIVVTLSFIVGGFSLWYAASTSQRIPAANTSESTPPLQSQLDTSNGQ